MNRMSRRMVFFLVAVFALWALTVRLLPHLANMTPIGALALVSGVYLPRRWGWLLPIGVLLASDAWLGGYELPVMLSVYGSFVVIALAGSLLRRCSFAIRVLVGPLASSTLFFLVTNFSVWLATPWYAKTIDGLITSYTLAIPFWRNMFVGDVLYTAAFFGIVFVTQKIFLRHLPCRQAGNLKPLTS